MPEDWLPTERLRQEHTAVGFYLSGHPLDDYVGALKRKQVLTLAELEQKASGGTVVAKIAGSVAGKQERKSARGNRFAFVQLSDTTGLYEVTVFSDTLEKFRDLLEPGQNVVLSVKAEMVADQLKLLAQAVQPVDGAVADAAAMGLKVFVNDEKAVGSIATRLIEISQGAGPRGRGPVHLVLTHPDLPGEVEMALPKEYPLNPQVKGALKHIQGVQMVEEF